LDVLSAVRYMTKSNLGRALDLLQLTKTNYNFITIETVSKMDSSLNFNIVKDLFTRTLEGNFKQIRATLRDIFYKYALAKSEIMTQLSRIVTQMPLPREIRSIYLDMIAEADFDSLDSNDDEIQLNALLSKMALIGREVRS
jgi:replication factor C small subunit